MNRLQSVSIAKSNSNETWDYTFLFPKITISFENLINDVARKRLEKEILKTKNLKENQKLLSEISSYKSYTINKQTNYTNLMLFSSYLTCNSNSIGDICLKISDVVIEDEMQMKWQYDMIVLSKGTIIYKGEEYSCEQISKHINNPNSIISMTWFGSEKTAKIYQENAILYGKTKKSLLLFELTNTKNLNTLITNICYRIKSCLSKLSSKNDKNDKHIKEDLIKMALVLKMYIGVVCATTGYLVNIAEQGEIVNMFIPDVILTDLFDSETNKFIEDASLSFDKYSSEQFIPQLQFKPFKMNDMIFGNLSNINGLKRFSHVMLDKLLALCIFECVPFIDGYYGMNVPFMYNKDFKSEICLYNINLPTNSNMLENDELFESFYCKQKGGTTNTLITSMYTTENIFQNYEKKLKPGFNINLDKQHEYYINDLKEFVKNIEYRLSEAKNNIL